MKKIIALTVVLILGFYMYNQNTDIEVNEHMIESEKIPKSFDGYKIAHISDFHTCVFGKDNSLLYEKLRNAKPDIIAVTGDIIDSRNLSVDIAVDFMKEAVKIAPVYYTTGNHESRLDELDKMVYEFEKIGVKVLKDSNEIVENNNEKIVISGVYDTEFNKKYKNYPSFEKRLEMCKYNDSLYTILLSHRPERFDEYADNKFDLVLCGHAHGGQIRLPFLGAFFAPDQGFMPKYTTGVYEKNGTKMAVSRGLGKSRIPFRINNKPEILVLELNKI